MSQRVAIFDFDHTLITGESFWTFLIFTAGRVRTFGALIEALFLVALCRVQGKEIEFRTFIKNHLLQRLLKGKKRDEVRRAALNNAGWQVINKPIMEHLRDHHMQGDKIVIASGGLDLYLPEMLKNIPYDALICTDIGVSGEVITGEMIHGNCVRDAKAERVGAWLAAHGPFDESFGYGNYPHDLPMLNLVKHRIIVS